MNRNLLIPLAFLASALLLLGCVQPTPTPIPTVSLVPTATPISAEFKCPDGTPQYGCSSARIGKYCSKLLVLENNCDKCGCPPGEECVSNVCRTPSPTPGPTAALPTPTPTPAAGPAQGTLEGLAASVQVAVAQGLNRSLVLQETTEAYGGYTQRIYVGGLRDANYELGVRVLRPATRWSSTDQAYIQRRSGETIQKAEVYWEQSSTFDKQTNKIRMPCYNWRLFIEANLEIYLPTGVDPQSSARLVRALIDACPD